MTRQSSLTWRLVSSVVLAELLCAAVLVTVTVVHERHEHLKAFDVSLRGRVDSVMGALQDADDPGANLVLTRSDLSLPKDDAFLVLRPDGSVLDAMNWKSEFPVPVAAGSSEFKLKHKPYREMRMERVRTIDPLTPGGGIKRPVTVIYVTPLGHVWHAIMEDVRFSVVTALAVLSLTAIALAWFVRRTLQPLRGLAEDAARVSADRWSFTPSNDVMGTRELKPVAESIQTLLGNLEQAFVERRRFVSDAAHELKTAVAVMKSSLQLLTMRPRSGEEYAAALERPLEDTERMETLVARMLTLGRVDEQMESAGCADLAAAVASSLRELEPLRDQREVRVETSLAEGVDTPVTAEDAGILCTNLLSNAMEHSAAGTTIRVRVVREAGRARLEVQDEGEGIPEEALPHLFERFYRVDKSRSRRTGGSGLGLAICQAIVAKAGGSIQVASQTGRGTTVTVRLPLTAEGRLHEWPAR